jgi:hypothetical protein
MKDSRAAAPEPKLVRVLSFQCVSFFDTKLDRQVVLLYTLGADGIVREFNGTAWREYPVTK